MYYIGAVYGRNITTWNQLTDLMCAYYFVECCIRCVKLPLNACVPAWLNEALCSKVVDINHGQIFFTFGIFCSNAHHTYQTIPWQTPFFRNIIMWLNISKGTSCRKTWFWVIGGWSQNTSKYAPKVNFEISHILGSSILTL